MFHRLPPEHTGTHRNIAKTLLKSLRYLTVFKKKGGNKKEQRYFLCSYYSSCGSRSKIKSSSLGGATARSIFR